VPGAQRHLTATALVVFIITVLTIIFGELVPKRLGQMYPELGGAPGGAADERLSHATRPLVVRTADGLHRGRAAPAGHARRAVAVGHRRGDRRQPGGRPGRRRDRGGQEHQMVRNVFRLDDRQIGSMMIPRAEIAWLDAEAAPEQVVAAMKEHGTRATRCAAAGLDDVDRRVVARPGPAAASWTAARR
jgi:putative hemolysin